MDTIAVAAAFSLSPNASVHDSLLYRYGVLYSITWVSCRLLALDASTPPMVTFSSPYSAMDLKVVTKSGNVSYNALWNARCPMLTPAHESSATLSLPWFSERPMGNSQCGRVGDISRGSPWVIVAWKAVVTGFPDMWVAVAMNVKP